MPKQVLVKVTYLYLPGEESKHTSLIIMPLSALRGAGREVAGANPFVFAFRRNPYLCIGIYYNISGCPRSRDSKDIEK
jgi:hypothetical protein